MNKNEKYYILENNRIVKEAEILSEANGFCTIRFLSTGGASRVRKSRLFSSEEEEKASILKTEIKEHR